MSLDVIPDRELIANARGLALAAFGPLAAIERALGCSAGEARAFQEQAFARFQGLIVKVAQARRAPGDRR